MTTVINLWGGPGAGKSSLAAGVFCKLKEKGVKVELVREYAKELYYDCDFRSFKDQYKILREQDWRQRSLLGEVDWIVTDAPLPMGLIYAGGDFAEDERFVSKTWALYNSYANVNVLVNRVKEYQEYGREQTRSEAMAVDEHARKMLALMRVGYVSVQGTPEAAQAVVDFIGVK